MDNQTDQNSPGLGVLSSQNSTSSEECPSAQKRKLPEVGEMRKKMKKNSLFK